MKTLGFFWVVVLFLWAQMAYGQGILLFPVEVDPGCSKTSVILERYLKRVLVPVFHVVDTSDVEEHLFVCDEAGSAQGCLKALGHFFDAETGLGGTVNCQSEGFFFDLKAADLTSGREVAGVEFFLKDLGFKAFAHGILPLVERVAKENGLIQEILGHRFVRLPLKEKGIYIQMEEVSQELWSRVTGYNPSHIVDCGGRCPVENVTAEEIGLFLYRMNTLRVGHFRLPTVREWQTACSLVSKEGPLFESSPCITYKGYPCQGWVENVSGCLHCGPRPSDSSTSLFPIHLEDNVREWLVFEEAGLLAGGSWAEGRGSSFFLKFQAFSLLQTMPGCD